MPLSRRRKAFPAAGHLRVLLKKCFVFIFIQHSAFLLYTALFLCFTLSQLSRLKMAAFRSIKAVMFP